MKFKLKSDRERKLHINMDVINTYASKWKSGTDFDVEIVRRVRRRSDPLRKYYFAAVLPPFMKELGYEPEDELMFHRQLKIVFFNVCEHSKGMYREKDIPSVFGNDSELGVPIKKQFVDWVIRKAAENGVYIPDPGEA